MTRAYDEMYLDDAMRTLGEAFDFALCDQGLSSQVFTDIFCNSVESKQFEQGMARVVCGMSGDELACEIIERAGLSPVGFRQVYPIERSPEYWTGWVLAYTQWASGLSFEELFAVETLECMIGSYDPLHEAPEEKFAEIVIDKWNRRQEKRRGLRAMRTSSGLTQRELAAASGVKLRSVQLYEQGQMDIDKASVSTVRALAHTLGCSIDDLIWKPIDLEFDSKA